MNVVWAVLVVLAVTAPALAAMLVVRRRAPVGSHFSDGDRAAGVFGVLATGFSVLLGFVVFLAFESYDQSRSGAEEEALVLAAQVRQYIQRASNYVLGRVTFRVRNSATVQGLAVSTVLSLAEARRGHSLTTNRA